jgi:hypothetical protein
MNSDTLFPMEPTTATTAKRRQDKAAMEIRRLKESGDASTQFRTLSGLLFAVGYQRIVFGDRGPYIEFTSDQIRCELRRHFDNELPPDSYYEWLDTPDCARAKVYRQVRTVKYADYRTGLFYVDPSLLRWTANH